MSVNQLSRIGSSFFLLFCSRRLGEDPKPPEGMHYQSTPKIEMPKGQVNRRRIALSTYARNKHFSCLNLCSDGLILTVNSLRALSAMKAQ